MQFNKDKQVSIICTKQKTAKNMIRKVRLIYQMLPDFLKPKIIQDNKVSLRLSNGSRCYAQRSTENAGRSESLSFLVFDQARFIDNIEQIWKSAYPTLSTGGNCALITTPNGINWFFKTHSARKRGQNQFHPIQLPWWLHPERGQEWKQKQIRNLGGQVRFKQQHQIDFQASGKSIVDLTILSQIQQEIRKSSFQPKKNSNVQDLYSRIINRIAQRGLSIRRQVIQRLWIFDQPTQQATYAITCDTSSGVGNDNSTMTIWDVNKYQEVRQFRGKIKPNTFAYMIAQVGKYYRNAFVAVQGNKDGSAVNLKLQQLRYTNMYYSQRMRKDIYGLDVQSAGLDTTGKSRPVMVAKMCQDVSKKHTIIKSIRLIEQLKTFIDKDGKPQRLRGYNDDLVIRLCIFCYLRSFVLMRQADWMMLNRFSASSKSQPRIVQQDTQNRQVGWLI